MNSVPSHRLFPDSVGPASLALRAFCCFYSCVSLVMHTCSRLRRSKSRRSRRWPPPWRVARAAKRSVLLCARLIISRTPSYVWWDGSLRVGWERGTMSKICDKIENLDYRVGETKQPRLLGWRVGGAVRGATHGRRTYV